ncbi:MAG: heme o synthase [Crocinitomicaceae bacterium]
MSSTTIESLKKESKFKSFLVFTKFRLSALVVISALSGYLFVVFRDGASVNWQVIFNLMVGGSLVTAASNGANQIWERELDIMMRRTQTRPLPQGRMNLKEAYLIVILCLVVGSWLLHSINFLSAFLGVCAFVSYVFIYTPMKRVTPWAVFVGAFPGAIPPMLGAIAYTNKFGLEPGILFFVQFVWQFPHFWAIAWVVFDDYKAGGFSLLPSKFGKSKNSAYQIMVYSLFLIPFTLLPWVLGWTGSATLVIGTILGGWFFWYSYRLFITCDDKDAKKLMFASFFYLPLVQFLYVLDYVPIKK